MSYRTVEIGSAARLHLQHRQMRIARDDGSAPTVPIEDLAVVILDNPAITCSTALLAALMEAKVATIVCGRDHMPAGVFLPYAANALAGERLRAQLACSRPLAKRLWQSIVACKLRRQSELLQTINASDAGLAAIASRVRSGDPDNLEAQGAQRYWPRLLGPNFRRQRAGSDANVFLNYGYAVLRAVTARAIVAAGLHAGIGLFHSNRGDPFALASDLMEPYRPFVDAVVVDLVAADLATGQLERHHKAHLLAVQNHPVSISGQTLPLALAVARTATSLAESFSARQCLIQLPDGAGKSPASGPIDAAAPADP